MEKRLCLLFAVLSTAAMSCSTSQKALTVDVLAGEWDVVKVDGRVVGSTEEGIDPPFIGFDTKDGRVYGSTGCNRLTGILNADAAKQTIDFGPIGSTRMMCADMETEQRVLDAIGRTSKFEVDGKGTLTLTDENGKAVMELKRKETER